MCGADVDTYQWTVHIAAIARMATFTKAALRIAMNAVDETVTSNTHTTVYTV